MNNYILESFITFCDDMMIAEEGFKEVGKIALLSLKKLIIQVKHIISNLSYSLRKMHKVYIPNEVEPMISKELDRLKDIKYEFLQYTDTYAAVLFIQRKNYCVDGSYATDIKIDITPYKSKVYSKLEYKSIDTKNLVNELKHADGMLKKAEIMYAELQAIRNEHDVDVSKQSIICDFLLKLCGNICNVLLMYFSWNNAYKSASSEIKLEHGGTATYDNPTNY